MIKEPFAWKSHEQGVELENKYNLAQKDVFEH